MPARCPVRDTHGAALATVLRITKFFAGQSGIAERSQVSMFSGFNQPDDISYSNRFDTLLGITEEEMYSVFCVLCGRR